ncbi:hypothetical protein ACP70R_031900 [Stipagrostis hirtigluma subsp. patula]
MPQPPNASLRRHLRLAAASPSSPLTRRATGVSRLPQPEATRWPPQPFRPSRSTQCLSCFLPATCSPDCSSQPTGSLSPSALLTRGRGRTAYCHGQQMDRSCVSLIFHHNGAFSKHGALTYEGGKVSIIRDVDKDLMSYFHVVDLAQNLGFKDGDILYYAIPGRPLEYGIDLLKDDASVNEMMKYANETNFLEIYVQHNQNAVGSNPTIGEAIHRDKTAERGVLVLCHEMRRRRLNILITLHVLLLRWLALIRRHQYRMVREPCRFDPASRSKKLNDMIYESDILCVEQLRMDRRCFWTLCSLVTEIGGLRATRNVTVEEMVAMFLHVLAYDEKSRSMRTDYQRSQETISRHFNNVLAAVLKLWRVLLKSAQPIPENCKDERWKWFKNCLDALWRPNGLKVPRDQNKKVDGKKRLKQKRRDKRHWTAEEEKILVDILYEMNDSGWKVDTGHKSGYHLYIEKELAKKLPNAQIKADPHIQSKVKTLKKQLSWILDIQQYGSGFGWDDDRKMVVGDKEAFMEWAKSRNGAAALYLKPFPNYDKLCEIYASDLAKGSAAKGPGEHMDSNGDHSTINLNEVPKDAEDSHSQATHPPLNLSGGPKPGGRKRFLHEDELWEAPFRSVSNSLQCLVEVEKQNAAVMTDIKTALMLEVEMQKQIEAQRGQLFAALSVLPGFTEDEIIKAACTIAKDVPTLGLFFNTPDDKKCAFVRHVIATSES